MTAVTALAPSSCLHGSDGVVCERGERWVAPAVDEDDALLWRVPGPVLDIGCGPGRHVSALAARGVPALGIDIAAEALEAARRGGAPVLRRSVFDHLPGLGRWGGALLLDGNVGIGADPARLLRRVLALLRPGGRLLVELAAPGGDVAPRQVCLELEGLRGPWFWWRRVPADELAALAGATGAPIVDEWVANDRRFATLARPAR